MTMILDAFLGNFKEMLTKMAQEEVGVLLGVPGEIEKLGRTVDDIRCLLSDAEGRQTKKRSIEQWLLELTDVMYDADDIMDLCQIKVEERNERRGNLSFSKFSCGTSMLSCLRNPVFAHKIGKQIKELNSRLNEIYERKSTLGLEWRHVVEPSNVRPVGSVPPAVLADIVGNKIKEDTAMLVKSLTNNEESVKENVSAVAIVGMPGIGKTTLAKKVFHDPDIQEVFPLRILVCVSKDLKEVQLLKCIIREAGGNNGAAEEISELVSKLASLVQNKKFFLVLDDVWPESQEVWNGLLREAMIGGARDSRLLVTTRDDRVARFFQATTTHHVQKLSDADAWSLLAKQVAFNEFDSDTLKDVGLQLVKKCDGLPLAIVAIGGILRGRGKNIREWQIISESTLWSLVPNNHYFPRAFYLSYEDLPSHLKQCFIFCSFYPEDFEFSKIYLVYMWLAEGFLCDKEDLSFYKMGLEYYKELVSRNLLEVVESYDDQGVCKMHDLLRSFAGDKRKGDSLIVGERESICRGEPSLKLRRLSIENSTVDLNLDFLNKEKSIRTLLLRTNSMSEVLFNAILLFSHLRFLDLSESNISSLSDSFGDLVQLRYLNLSETNLETLPNCIGYLRKLVYLDVSGCKNLSHFPSSIVNLVELRYFCYCQTNVEVFPTGLRKLKKLTALCGFQPGNNCSSSGLKDLGTLSLLSAITLFSMEKITDISEAKEANLGGKDLEELYFTYKPNQGCQVSKPTEEKKAAQVVLNALSAPPSLQVLKIFYYFGDQLPIWLHVGITKLKFLRYLHIKQCECFSQFPPLGQLPNLENLTIEGANSIIRIGREFLFDDSQKQIGTNVSHSWIPFPLLKILNLYDMLSWVEWLWDEGQPAMPKLKTLYIVNCPMLSSLPKGLLCHATSLEILRICGVKQLKSVEDLELVKELYVIDNSNLERISNLANLSFIQIKSCPNLKILENLKPCYRMELEDNEMETLPEYLRKAELEKLIVRCTEELLVMITSLGVGSPEWQKFEHIPVVKFYCSCESLYATYQKTPFRFTTNVDSSVLSSEED